MLHPAPTTPISPSLCRGVLHEVTAAHIVVEFPNTNYLMHLKPTAPITTPVGKRLVGTITVSARRVDVVETGGKYVEPLTGRPRRVQGRVVSLETRTNELVVDAGMSIHLKLTDPRQRADAFKPGDLVSCDVMEGATFSPQS